MTDEQCRETALALDGVAGGAHMGHPEFRASGRIFASLRIDGVTAMVRLMPDQQAMFLHEPPEMCSPAAGPGGRGSHTAVALPKAGVPAVRAVMHLAWELALSNPRSRERTRSKPRASQKAR
jgi:hypothetical protein